MGIISLVMDKMVPLFGKSNGWIRVRVMVFNTTFNNISVISWWSVLLVEKNGVPGKKTTDLPQVAETLSHNFVSSTPRLSGIRIHNISGDRH